MANRNTQEAVVNVTLNGEQAKHELGSMKEQLAKMTTELKRLQSTSIGLMKPGEAQKMEELRKETKKLERTVTSLEEKERAFARTLKNINSASLKDLQAAARRLSYEVKELTPGTQQFIEKSKQLQQVNTRIVKLRSSFKGLIEDEKSATLSLKGLADGFNKYFGMVTAGIAAVTGMSMAFRKAAEEAAKLDDTYSDVMKTTGLMHDEVAALDQELMKIDTRTSREQLLLLARDAGKLGIQGKENILGFVRAADQLQVALGEDLGEGAIRNLGKIADVLGYTDSMGIEKSLLSIGSAINAVGQASTASEGYLVDFTQRLAGVAAQTGISAANIIGFASGLDQSAMKVEMASTAFQKFLMKLYEDPAKFAAYAHLEVGKFTDLLQNDANQAVITILKALKDQDGFASLVPIFKDMGLDGARAVSVLAAMATNINAVTEAQALANVEFSKATSVTEEYNTKNNNMQAQLEKARKEFQNASIALGQSLNPIMLKSTKATTYLIKALATYGKEIKTVVITMAALTTAIKLQTIAQKGLNAANKLGQTIQKTGQTIAWAYRVAVMKLTGQTQLATFAQAELNKVMSASVFGLVATAVSALVFGISRLVRNYREAAEAADWEATIEKKVNKEYAEQASRVKALTAIVENNNLALSERKKALEELRNLVPDYHGDLTKEGKLINSNKEAIDEYCKSLRQMIRLQTHKDELQELEQQIIEKEDELEKARQKQREALIKAGGDTTESYSTLGGLKFTDYGKASGKVRVLEKELESLYVRENQISVKMGELTKGSVEGLTEEQREIEEVRKKYEQLFNDAKNAYVGAPAEGMKALGKLQEQMDEEIAAIRKKYAQPTSPTGGGGGDGLTDKEAKKAFDKEIALLEQNMREEEIILKQSLMNREITQAEYNARMNLLTMKSLQERINIAKKYGQDTTKYTSQLLDEEIKLVGDGMAELEEKMTGMAPKSNIVDPQANEQFWDEIYKKREDIVAQLQDKSLKNQYDTEMMWLEKLHQNEMLSEEEFQKAKFQTKLKYAQQYAEQFNSLTSQAGDMVKAIQDAELANEEAKYQEQLAAAGDNAEERERIEAEHEKKKLEIQKKYADADMVINIAKTIGAGALAIMQAFAQLGPVAGAVAAAMIGVTTAAEVATIIAQRNAIKNASAGGGSGSASLNTGTRTITGYSEGGNTPWSASDDTPVGVVHANEWVAPAWMKRREPLLFASLERYRKAGSHGRSGSMSSGFAAGGNTGSGALAISQGGDLHSAVKVAIVDAFESGAVRVVLVRKDLSELDAQSEKFEKMTSRS